MASRATGCIHMKCHYFVIKSQLKNCIQSFRLNICIYKNIFLFLLVEKEEARQSIDNAKWHVDQPQISMKLPKKTADRHKEADQVRKGATNKIRQEWQDE